MVSCSGTHSEGASVGKWLLQDCRECVSGAASCLAEENGLPGQITVTTQMGSTL